MQNTKTHSVELKARNSFSKFDDYIMLTKIKLSATVVFSSVLGYLISSAGSINVASVLLLVVGGFLVTAAANTLNQVLEREFDSLMVRTANRPVAAGRMKSSEALMFAGVLSFMGITILATFNPLTGLLGMLSLILYAFVYTPLKRYSPIAVTIGAIPGALPVLIGSTAFEGTLSYIGFGLFIIQFLWQFPHFWAIGFVGQEDYQKAGFELLPRTKDGLSNSIGLASFIYALLIVPIAFGLLLIGEASLLSTILVVLLSLVYAYFSWKFYKLFDKASALKLMFLSFGYLPVVLLTYWIF